MGGDLPIDLEIQFEPNLTLTKQFYVVNSVNSQFPMYTRVESDVLHDYVTISERDFVLGPRDGPSGMKHLNFTLSLPEKIDLPGRHMIIILATQNLTSNGQGITARLELGYVFWVFVPFPGKYIEFTIKIENAKVNESVKFTASTKNRGKETIEEAQFTYKIFDPAGSLVATFNSDKKSIQPNEALDFVNEWLANDIRPGKYHLVAEVSYDGIKQSKTTDFMMGSPTATILNVVSSPIMNGSIGRITAEVASEWNERINEMNVLLNFKKNSVNYNARSNTFELGPFEAGNVSIFWDTSSAGGAGKYEGLATLYYLNKTSNTTFTAEVVEGGFGSGSQFIFIILIAAIMVLIALPVVMLVLRKRKNKKFGQKRLA